MITLTSSVPYSMKKTPLTLDWAEENYELFSQGMLFKSFAIVKRRIVFCLGTWTRRKTSGGSSQFITQRLM